MYSLLLLMLLNNTDISLTSRSFPDNGNIPLKYTCEGQNINPALAIGELPKGTASITLIVDDPDAANGVMDHWVVYNIDPTTKQINENSTPGIVGKNGSGKAEYKGPCPPDGMHHYYFKIYALDTKLKLAAGAPKQDVEKAMDGHILGSGQLIGLYKKQSKK